MSVFRRTSSLFSRLCFYVPSCHVGEGGEGGECFDADFLTFFWTPRGRSAEPQQWLSPFLEGDGEVGVIFFFWGGAGVYLSHGNWFAGVEVGSFEKTSFSLTPSHLSAWKAAGRGWWRVLLQRHFHTESVWGLVRAQSDASMESRMLFASLPIAPSFPPLCRPVMMPDVFCMYVMRNGISAWQNTTMTWWFQEGDVAFPLQRPVRKLVM